LEQLFTALAHIFILFYFLNIFGDTRRSNRIVAICIGYNGCCCVPVIYFGVQIKAAVNSFVPFNYLPAIGSKPAKYGCHGARFDMDCFSPSDHIDIKLSLWHQQCLQHRLVFFL
jgi:hypothetical protein